MENFQKLILLYLLTCLLFQINGLPVKQELSKQTHRRNSRAIQDEIQELPNLSRDGPTFQGRITRETSVIEDVPKLPDETSKVFKPYGRRTRAASEKLIKLPETAPNSRKSRETQNVPKLPEDNPNIFNPEGRKIRAASIPHDSSLTRNTRQTPFLLDSLQLFSTVFQGEGTSESNVHTEKVPSSHESNVYTESVINPYESTVYPDSVSFTHEPTYFGIFSLASKLFKFISVPPALFDRKVFIFEDPIDEETDIKVYSHTVPSLIHTPNDTDEVEHRVSIPVVPVSSDLEVEVQEKTKVVASPSVVETEVIISDSNLEVEAQESKVDESPSVDNTEVSVSDSNSKVEIQESKVDESPSVDDTEVSIPEVEVSSNIEVAVQEESSLDNKSSLDGVEVAVSEEDSGVKLSEASTVDEVREISSEAPSSDVLLEVIQEMEDLNLNMTLKEMKENFEQINLLINSGEDSTSSDSSEETLELTNTIIIDEFSKRFQTNSTSSFTTEIKPILNISESAAKLENSSSFPYSIENSIVKVSGIPHIIQKLPGNTYPFNFYGMIPQTIYPDNKFPAGFGEYSSLSEIPLEHRPVFDGSNNLKDSFGRDVEKFKRSENEKNITSPS